MKTIFLFLTFLYVFCFVQSQNGNTIFVDSLPGLVNHARGRKLEAVKGINLQYRIDEEGEMFSGNYSRIGRKWGFFIGLTKRIHVFTYNDSDHPFPGINFGGQFYPNRLHSTLNPFFHAETIVEYSEGYRDGFHARVRLGYGNLIHLNKYFYTDFRGGIGYTFAFDQPNYTVFFGLGIGYNMVNYGRDHRK
jgi:hypothetical protein